MRNPKIEGRGGRGGGRSGNAGQGSNRNYQSRYDWGNDSTGNNFTGRIPELEGFIFDVSTVTNTDACKKSLKEIADYMATSLKYGGDKIQEIILSGNDVHLTELTNPGATATRAEVLRYETAMKLLVQQEIALVENSKKAYTSIWRQCTDHMRVKLLTTPNWDRISQDKDLAGLVTAIRGLGNKFEGHRDAYLAIVRAVGRVYTFYQGKLTDNEFEKQFRQRCAVVEQYGGTFGRHPELMKKAYIAAGLNPDAVNFALTAPQQETTKQFVSERCKARIFVNNLSRERHGAFQEFLANQHANGVDTIYPNNIADAIRRAGTFLSGSHQRSDYGRRGGRGGRGGCGGGRPYYPSHDNDGNIVCFKCGKSGHIASQCTQNLMFHLSSSQGKRITRAINQEWILLDNQSTVDVFSNSSKLQNIQKTTNWIRIHSNGGTSVVDQEGYLPGYGWVYYDPKGIANILSLDNVASKRRVVFDSK